MTSQGQFDANNIELIVFETQLSSVQNLKDAGFNSFIVDLEYRGKDLRQLGFNTEINQGNVGDISVLKKEKEAEIWCRINCFGEWTHEETESTLENGAVNSPEFSRHPLSLFSFAVQSRRGTASRF